MPCSQHPGFRSSEGLFLPTLRITSGKRGSTVLFDSVSRRWLFSNTDCTYEKRFSKNCELRISIKIEEQKFIFRLLVPLESIILRMNVTFWMSQSILEMMSREWSCQKSCISYRTNNRCTIPGVYWWIEMKSWKNWRGQKKHPHKSTWIGCQMSPKHIPIQRISQYIMNQWIHGTIGWT